eukprot:Trichotokara_eunicae@DN4507_c0_g1_i1.p1
MIGPLGPSDVVVKEGGEAVVVDYFHYEAKGVVSEKFSPVEALRKANEGTVSTAGDSDDDASSSYSENILLSCLMCGALLDSSRKVALASAKGSSLPIRYRSPEALLASCDDAQWGTTVRDTKYALGVLLYEMFSDDVFLPDLSLGQAKLLIGIAKWGRQQFGRPELPNGTLERIVCGLLDGTHETVHDAICAMESEFLLVESRRRLELDVLFGAS